MTDAPTPELAILLVADSYAMIRKVLDRFHEQGDAARLESVEATLRATDITEDRLRAEGFTNARVVTVDSDDLAVAERRALEIASAPFVIFAQAHAYPKPGFVDAILEVARSRLWAVVGPSMANANPSTALSRAAMEIGYGTWCEPTLRGPVSTAPGHSSAYDRDAVSALGDDLVRVLPAGRQLQLEIRARGGEIFLEPAASVEVVNVSRLGAFLADQYRQGRLVAGERILHWSWPHRFVYAVAAPVIPIVRLARISAHAARSGRGTSLVADLPAHVLGLVTSAVGEMVGYVFGKSARRDAEETSLHRTRYAREPDTSS